MPTLAETGFKSVRDVWSTHKIRMATYTGPAAYVAGGDSFVPTDMGLGTFDGVDVLGLAWNGSAVRLVTYDYTAQKFVWYVPNTGAEASGDLSAYTVRILVIGQ